MIYKNVITYGTFDLLHVGHVRLLRRAKSLEEHLVVALSTDEFNKIKGKTSVLCYEERYEILSAIKYVDKIIPENNWEQKIQDILAEKIDCFVMGNDWEGKFDFLKTYCSVVYLPRTEDISTTQLKTDLKNADETFRTEFFLKNL